MANNDDDNRQNAEVCQEERRPWQKPVLSEASLRHFTEVIWNNTTGDSTSDP